MTYTLKVKSSIKMQRQAVGKWIYEDYLIDVIPSELHKTPTHLEIRGHINEVCYFGKFPDNCDPEQPCQVRCLVRWLDVQCIKVDAYYIKVQGDVVLIFLNGRAPADIQTTDRPFVCVTGRSEVYEVKLIIPGRTKEMLVAMEVNYNPLVGVTSESAPRNIEST